jgi:hypothetical protein
MGPEGLQSSRAVVAEKGGQALHRLHYETPIRMTKGLSEVISQNQSVGHRLPFVLNNAFGRKSFHTDG